MNSLWKTLLITLLLLLPAAGRGAETAKRTPQGRIVSLVSEYRSCDGRSDRPSACRMTSTGKTPGWRWR